MCKKNKCLELKKLFAKMYQIAVANAFQSIHKGNGISKCEPNLKSTEI